MKKMITVFVLIIVLIFVLPLPKKVEKTYFGVNTENGETVDITLDMKYFRFFVIKDKLYGAITVKTPTETFVFGEHLHYTGQTSINQEKDLAHNFSGWYYNETMHLKEYENGTVSQMPIGFEGLLAHISSDFDKILIFHNTTFENSAGEVETRGNSRYIGSAQPSQLEETKQYFSGYYD